MSEPLMSDLQAYYAEIRNERLQCWIPTPAEVKQRAAEIRESWSEAERRKRAFHHDSGYIMSPPEAELIPTVSPGCLSGQCIR